MAVAPPISLFQQLEDLALRLSSLKEQLPLFYERFSARPGLLSALRKLEEDLDYYQLQVARAEFRQHFRILCQHLDRLRNEGSIFPFSLLLLKCHLSQTRIEQLREILCHCVYGSRNGCSDK